MEYKETVRGIFLKRPNRFIAHVLIQGREERVHVKNTGRCRELLVPGTEVVLERSQNPERKTKYDLICVYKGESLINMDSQAPNKAAKEWIEKGGLFQEKVEVQTEKRYGNSRFDLFIQSPKRKAFLEVKGVTLEEGGIARFPDAPTERGVKHVRELIQCRKDGYEAYLLFVIQMKGIRFFEPNWETHREFGLILKKAEEAGVRILARDCLVKENSMEIQDKVPLFLDVPKTIDKAKG